MPQPRLVLLNRSGWKEVGLTMECTPVRAARRTLLPEGFA
jgi:hypothetical protein